MKNISKYVDFGTMTFAEFSKSKVGTKAKFLLTCEKNAREEVSKTLKASCYRAKTKCKISSVELLVKENDTTWQQSHILETEIIE